MIVLENFTLQVKAIIIKRLVHHPVRSIRVSIGIHRIVCELSVTLAYASGSTVKLYNFFSEADSDFRFLLQDEISFYLSI